MPSLSGVYDNNKEDLFSNLLRMNDMIGPREIGS